MADNAISVKMVDRNGRTVVVPRASAGAMTQYGYRIVPQQEVSMGSAMGSPIMDRGSILDQIMNRKPQSTQGNVVRTPPGPLNDRQYTPDTSAPVLQATAAPASPVVTAAQMMATRAKEQAAKAKAEADAKAAKAPRILAARPATTAVKPGATPSTRGRTVVGAVAPKPAASKVKTPAASTRAPANMYTSIPAGMGYGGAPSNMYTSIPAGLGYGAPAPAPAGVPAQQAFAPQLMAQVADYIASATPTGPVSPYSTMNQYGGTTGPPATSVQNSKQAAAIAARNATADQLSSAEFRATLDQLLREAGLPSQFGTPDSQLAARDYRF